MAKKVNVRVSIPKNVQELLELSSNVYAKHVADGSSSPLNALQDVKWETIGPKIAVGLQKHFEAEDLKRKMELAYKERDASVVDISEVLAASRDLLKSIYSKTPKKLGEWGFDTADSPKAMKKIASTTAVSTY